MQARGNRSWQECELMQGERREVSPEMPEDMVVVCSQEKEERERKKKQNSELGSHIVWRETQGHVHLVPNCLPAFSTSVILTDQMLT